MNAATEQALLRANSQLSHFGSGANGGLINCDHCGKPLNRWDEKCEYQPDAAHLLAEDVVAAVAENQRLRDALEQLVGSAVIDWSLSMADDPSEYRRIVEVARDVLAGTSSEDTE
jgi:hypothetical protein